MNKIINMALYRSRMIIDGTFGDSFLYCGWSNRRLGLDTSPLANPYTDKPNARPERINVHSRPAAIEMYRRWLWQQIKEDNQQVVEELLYITPDTVLGCWCYPKACHCEVISKASSWIKRNR